MRARSRPASRHLRPFEPYGQFAGSRNGNGSPLNPCTIQKTSEKFRTKFGTSGSTSTQVNGGAVSNCRNFWMPAVTSFPLTTRHGTGAFRSVKRSYIVGPGEGKERPRQDSNLEPSAPEADALSNCATRTLSCRSVLGHRSLSTTRLTALVCGVHPNCGGMGKRQLAGGTQKHGRIPMYIGIRAICSVAGAGSAVRPHWQQRADSRTLAGTSPSRRA